MSEHFQQAVHEAALRYVARGWAVFPLHSVVESEGKLQCTCGTVNCSDAGKHPRQARGLKDASKDVATIDKWFGPGSELSNIGVVTGMISGITVLDIDTGPGKAGAETWSEIVAKHGEFPTLSAITGSGGFHTFYTYNSALKTAANVLGPGVDVRNDGGYVVAAPSLHRSGGVYSWEQEDAPCTPLPPHLSRPVERRGRKKKDDMHKSKYSIEQVKKMLEYIAADDRDEWRHIGVILGREFKLHDKAWEVYFNWSETFKGKKGRNHDEIMKECFYDLSQQESEVKLSIGTIVRLAMEGGWAPQAGEVPMGHFVFYGPGNNFIYRPTASYWQGPAVDAAVSPVNIDGVIFNATTHLKLTQLCTSLTSNPQLDDDFIPGKDCRDGDLIDIPGAAVYNNYRRATIELGDARLAGPFLKHVRMVFNKAQEGKKSDADQFLDYMAHRVQKPWEKPRFALLLAGQQGAGKDTCIDMCAPAIGPWNLANIAPEAFEHGFNEFYAATLVRVSETSNLQEMSKWAFNEQTKVLIAGNPDNITINPKYGQKYTVKMYCGVIMTTNHLASGIYIPPGDRRYDVIESATLLEMGLQDDEKRSDYFEELWGWFKEGGDRHVAAFLHERDIKAFRPATGQRKTEAHSTVVAAGMGSDAWLIDAIDELGAPDLVRGDWIIDLAEQGGMKAAEARTKLAVAIGRVGYQTLRNPNASDGRWKINRKNVVVYRRVGSEDNDMAPLHKERF